jgi:Ca2+-binding RTX toxin-like protein
LILVHDLRKPISTNFATTLLKHIWTSITPIFVLTVLVITITISIPPDVVYAVTIYCLPGVNCIGTDNDDKIVGSSDDDDIDGKGGNDTITGSDGFDIITGGNGTDEIFGGKGND